MSRVPAINGWTCDRCGQVTYCVDVDLGVTPFYLACRRNGQDPSENACEGMGSSMFYPKRKPPPRIIDAVRWEWYAPGNAERAALKRSDPLGYEHVRKGGLMLRPLGERGRAALEQIRSEP